MKKSLLLLPVSILVLSLVSCNDTPNTEDNIAGETSTTSSQNETTNDRESNTSSKDENTTSGETSTETNSSSNSSTSETSSSENETSSSGETDSSSSSENETSSSGETTRTTWKEDALADMKKAFSSKEDMVLPFPSCFTDNYVNASMEDPEDGTFLFVAYDNVGDKVESYVEQLDEWGVFTNEGYDEEYDEYFFTYNVGDESLTTLALEVYYNSDLQNTEMIAYEVKDSGYLEVESFPYEYVSTELGVTVEASNVPSFELKQGTKYYVSSYSEEARVSISGETESDITETYKANLVSKGYEVTVDAQGINKAHNSNFGLGVDFSNYESNGSNVFSVEIYRFETPVQGDTKISLSSSDFAEGYNPQETIIKNNETNFEIGYINFMSTNGYIQSPKASKKEASLYNKTQIKHLNSLVCEIDANSVSYYEALHLFVGNLETSLTTEITPLIDGTTVTYNVDRDCKYFKLTNTGNNSFASKLTSMVFDLVI